MVPTVYDPSVLPTQNSAPQNDTKTVDYERDFSGVTAHFEDRPTPQRVRRKSVLPVDENVLSELARHKSLEDVLSKKKAEGERPGNAE
ncbi:hypothetical protein BC830DRAFT_1171754 [Chytriomyces sp. MP71]|nr:hypothetical protein BC830DRAFT_1171754 [Chytriomyces sp. MP71]